MDIKKIIKKPLLSKKLTRPKWYLSSERSNKKFWLDKNENIDNVLNKKIKKIIHKLDPEFIYGYPDTYRLYSKLSNFLDISQKNILLTNGSDGGIKAIFDAFINYKDKLMLTNPTFQMYSVYSKIFHTNEILINYKNIDNKPFLKIEDIIFNIRKNKPKVFFLANPDSPTGTIFFENDLKIIAKECKKNGTIFVLDEAYYPYTKILTQNLIKHFNNVIIIRSFAKSWGIAGLRVGYVISNKELINLLHKSRPMYEINSLANELVIELINNYEIIEESIKSLKNGQEFFTKKMIDLGCTSYKSYANFFHLKIPNKKIIKEIGEVSLFKKNFDHPSLKGYSRFSSAPKTVYNKIIQHLVTKNYF